MKFEYPLYEYELKQGKEYYDWSVDEQMMVLVSSRDDRMYILIYRQNQEGNNALY